MKMVRTSILFRHQYLYVALPHAFRALFEIPILIP